MRDYHCQLSVPWIKQRCLPFIESELSSYESNPAKNTDCFEKWIVMYQVVCFWMSFLYMHGRYLKSIDPDLVVICTLLLTKKTIYKWYLKYLEGARTLRQDSESQANF